MISAIASPDLTRVTAEVVVPADAGGALTVLFTAHVAQREGGRYFVTGLALDAVSDELTPTMLRHIPVVQIVSAAVYERIRPTIVPPTGGPTPAALGHLVEVYDAALAAGCPPIKAICDAFDFARPKAADWVRRARLAGLIKSADEWRPKRDKR